MAADRAAIANIFSCEFETILYQAASGGCIINYLNVKLHTADQTQWSTSMKEKEKKQAFNSLKEETKAGL